MTTANKGGFLWVIIMSEYIVCEVLEMNGEPAEGVCLGVGYYPDDAKTLPTTPIKKPTKKGMT